MYLALVKVLSSKAIMTPMAQTIENTVLKYILYSYLSTSLKINPINPNVTPAITPATKIDPMALAGLVCN